MVRTIATWQLIAGMNVISNQQLLSHRQWKHLEHKYEPARKCIYATISANKTQNECALCARICWVLRMRIRGTTTSLHKEP